MNREFKGMTSALVATMVSVLEAVYNRLDDIGVEIKWTYGGYVIVVNKSGELTQLDTFEDCLKEIRELTD